MHSPDATDDPRLPDKDPDRLIDASNVEEPSEQKPRPLGASSDRAMLAAIRYDTLAIVLFAVIGRASHGEGLSFGQVLSTAMPFLAGAYITLLLVVRYFHPLAIWTSGVFIASGTWLIGLAGRMITGQTNAPAFMAVSAAFLAATMVGWRILRALVCKRRNNSRN